MKEPYPQKNGVHFLITSIEAAPSALQNIPKLHLQFIALLLVFNEEMDFFPLRHEPELYSIPGFQNPHAIGADHDSGEQTQPSAASDPVPGVDGSDDDFLQWVGDWEVKPFENELPLVGEWEGSGLSLWCLELDAAMASRLPVVALREDFDGENRAFAE